MKRSYASAATVKLTRGMYPPLGWGPRVGVSLMKQILPLWLRARFGCLGWTVRFIEPWKLSFGP